MIPSLRDLARSRPGAEVSRMLARINARHPWNHNDYFHSWILANLPAQRNRALDVGCGRGQLLAELAGRFEEVIGVDANAGMREAARMRCTGLPGVTPR